MYASQRAENVRCWSDICGSAHCGAKDSLNLGTDPHQREEAYYQGFTRMEHFTTCQVTIEL